MIKAYLLILIITISTFAQAGVKDHSDRFALTFLSQTQTYELEIISNTTGDTVLFKPNNHSQVGIGISAFGLGGAVFNSTAFTQEDIQQKGKSKYEDFSGSLFLGSKDQFLLSGYYNRYKGFYIENSQSVDPSVGPTDPFIQNSNLETFRLGGTLYYVFKPDELSLSAHLGQSAQQTSSNGSWFVRVSYDGLKIKSDQAFIPAVAQASYGADGLIEDGEFNTASLTLGYGHAWISSNNWFLFLQINLGTGSQFLRYKVNGETKSTTKQAFKGGSSIVTGYNGNDFYTGLKIDFDNTELPLETIKINTSSLLRQFFLGRRF